MARRVKKRKLNVLSLFDGMSCGQIALERAGIPIETYYASEIDKYAIKVTQANYPDTIQLGDVRGIRAGMLPKIDMILAGSPCQGFSFAGKQLNFNDERSALFFEFMRLLKEFEPMFFLLENVIMSQQSNDVISCMLGELYPECVTQGDMFKAGRLEPIQINSALVSAQNRQRLHWVNAPDVEQPEDRGILLEDILECGSNMVIQRGRGKNLGGKQEGKSPCMGANAWQQNVKVPVIKNLGELIYKPHKAMCLDANYFKGPDNHGQRTGIVSLGGIEEGRRLYDGKNLSRNYREGSRIHSTKGKAVTLSASSKGGPGGHSGLYSESLNSRSWRKLSCIECERLQTVDDNYTNHVSDTQRYKMLGNGWTVEVIVHILLASRTLWERAGQ